MRPATARSLTMAEQPTAEPAPTAGDDSERAEAPEPPAPYGRAPDPHGAYPGPEEGGFAPLPDLVPDEYGPPGPGYGPPGGDDTPPPPVWWRRLRASLPRFPRRGHPRRDSR